MSTPRVRNPVMVCVALALLAACDGSGSIAPLLDGISEPLALSLRIDSPGTGGPTPTATIGAVPGGVTVLGRRDVDCGTTAEGVVRRVGNEIQIIAHVRRNWLSACAEVPGVLTYQGDVTGLDAGSYRVRLYETFLGGPARLTRSATVTVPSAAP